jgi:hypothetical protein
VKRDCHIYIPNGKPCYYANYRVKKNDPVRGVVVIQRNISTGLTDPVEAQAAANKMRDKECSEEVIAPPIESAPKRILVRRKRGDTTISRRADGFFYTNYRVKVKDPEWGIVTAQRQRSTKETNPQAAQKVANAMREADWKDFFASLTPQEAETLHFRSGAFSLAKINLKP